MRAMGKLAGLRGALGCEADAGSLELFGDAEDELLVELQLLGSAGRVEPVHVTDIHGPVAELGDMHEWRVPRVEAFMVR